MKKGWLLSLCGLAVLLDGSWTFLGPMSQGRRTSEIVQNIVRCFWLVAGNCNVALRASMLAKAVRWIPNQTPTLKFRKIALLTCAVFEVTGIRAL